MKKIILIFLLFSIPFLGHSQAKTEYLTIKVQYGLKTSGFVEDIWVDIGKSGQHSLSGRINNKDGVIVIDGREYVSVIDVLNILGNEGWKIYETRDMKILSDSYHEYFLIKEKEE